MICATPFFPASAGLRFNSGLRRRVYDTGDHAISGFSQQQGGDQSLTFTSQYGLVRVADLPLIAPGAAFAEAGSGQDAAIAESPSRRDAPGPPPTTSKQQAQTSAPPARGSGDDIFTMIERLADLRQKNILTEEEFAAKKAELLSRL